MLAGAFLADVNAVFFGLPLSLFPAINASRFGGDPRTLGLFTAAIGVGGLVSAVLSGPVRHVSRQGLAMLVSVCLWGASFAVFALASSLWLTLLSLAAAGAADTVTVVLRGMIVATVTPDEFRGRVTAAEYVAGAVAIGVALPAFTRYRFQIAATASRPGTPGWRSRRSRSPAR